MKINKRIAFALFLFGCTSVYAVPFAGESVITTIKTAMEGAAGNIASTAIIWLGAFASIQLFMTNFALLKSGGDIEAVFGKFVGSVAWIGFCVYVLMNGSAFIETVGNGVFGIVGGGLPSASEILVKALALAAKLFGISMVGAALPLVGNTLGPFINYTLIFFVAVAVLFAFKIFMIQLELGLIIMLAPLSFAFLGLNTLKDQGIAPFKALISLVYRIILMMVIMKAFGNVDDIIAQAVTTYANMSYINQTLPSNIGDLANGIFSGIIAYMLLAYLLFKSDSIAASLSSGSTNMGTADVASAAALGAATGAAVATGGAGTAAGAAKVPQSMAGFMSKLAGGGSLSNASSRGTGGASEVLKPIAPVSSVAGGGGNAASSFSTSSTGAPRKAAASAPSAGSGAPASGDFASTLSGGGSPPGATSVGGNDAPAQPASMEATESSPAFPTSSTGAPRKAAASAPSAGSGASASGDFASTLSGGGSPPGATSVGGNGAPARPASTATAAATPAFETSSSGAPRKAAAPSAPSPSAGSGAAASGDFATAMSSGSPPGATTAVDGSPVQPVSMAAAEATPAFETSSKGAPRKATETATSGSGTGASMGVPGSSPAATMDDVLQALSKQNAPKKTFQDHLGNVNRQIEQEKAAAVASINVNAAE